MGRAQLGKIDAILGEKRRVAKTYTEALSAVPGLRLPVERAGVLNVYWMYGIVVEDEFGLSRDELISRLAERGIESRTFFCPMNLQPFLRRQPGFRDVPCPVAEDLWHRGCYLPSSIVLTREDIFGIAEEIATLAGVAA
jgi:perosamine synthetase